MCSEWCASLPACLLRNNKSPLCPAQARRNNYSCWLNHLPQSLLDLQLLSFWVCCHLPIVECCTVMDCCFFFFFLHAETMMGVVAVLPMGSVCKCTEEGKWFKVCLWLKLRHTVCCEFICRSASISSRHDTFIRFSDFPRKSLRLLES